MKLVFFSKMHKEQEEYQLSASSIQALTEFLTETPIYENIDTNSMKFDYWKMFQENWQLSQFWYSKEFSLKLADLVIENAATSDAVAFISCPTLYFQLKQIEKLQDDWILLEYDTRFKQHSNFHFYDYNHPINLGLELKGRFDMVCIDPPFLSEECISKAITTTEYLLKKGGKVLFSTGAVFDELLDEKMGLKARAGYDVLHFNGLSNQLKVFTNF